MANNKETNKNDGSSPKKCFVMMPFSDTPDYEPNHFQKVYDQIIVKIIDNIVNCDMAICDLSSNNPNVLYELGLRHAFDKPVVLINDDKTKRIFDIQGISIIPYRSNRLYDEVVEDRKIIIEAIKANEHNNSGYSMMNLVKLSKASFDENSHSENPSELNTALLRRIISMLEYNKATDSLSENNNGSGPIVYSNKTIYELDRIDTRIDTLKNIISASINGDLDLNTSSVKKEIAELLSLIDQYMNLKNISVRDYRKLKTQKEHLIELLSMANDI